MPVLIAERKPNGRIGRMCTIQCYDAKAPRCRCICRGRNHGVGRNQAIQNTHEYMDWLNDAQDAGEFIIKPGLLEFFLS